MTDDSTPELLRLDELEGKNFLPLSLSVRAGAGVCVRSPENRALTELVDVLGGLSPADGGRLSLFGEDPAALAESNRLALLSGIGYATDQAGLISNLKVWENLVLPLRARGLAESPQEIEQLEKPLVGAFAAAGYDEAWIKRALADSPDHLTDFEKLVCGLVRCHLCGFRLLVCDRLFEKIDHMRSARLAKLIDWIGGRHPDSGLLLVHHGRDVGEAFGLSAWEPVENVSMETR